MPIIDKYKQIQTNLANKKSKIQQDIDARNKAGLNAATNPYTQALEDVGVKPSAGVIAEQTPVVPPVTPQIVNNGPVANKTTPQEPTPTPVVEPVKEEVKPTEQPKPTEKPMTLEETAKQADSWIAQAPPKGFQYGNVIDPKTGLPQLVNTAEVKRQKELKKNASIYTSGQSLYDGIKSGSILPGTDAFSDLQQANPQVFAEYEALKKQEEAKNKINNVGKIIMGEPVETKQSSTLTDLLDKVSSGLDEDISSIYKNTVLNNEDYIAANKKSTDLATQLAKVENDINLIGEDMRKKITGETPESVIASKIAREAKPLLDKATYLQNQLEIAQADANRIMADNKGMFEIQMADRADKRNLAFQLYNTINAEEIRQEDIAREEDRITKEISLEEYRYQRALADGNTVRAEERKQKLEDLREERDYNMNIGLLQLGVDPTGMTPEDMKAAYASATIAEKNKEDAYKEATLLREEKFVNEDGSEGTRWINPITNKVVTPQETFGEETPDVDFEQILSGYSEKGQELLLVPDGTVVPTRLDEVSPQNASIRGKECAEYVNDIAGTKMGSSYKSKTDICNQPSGGVGSIVAWQPNGSGQYGHTGIKVGEDDKYEYIKSSNYVPGTVTTEKIPKGTIKNYYTPESVKNLQSQSQAQSSQEPMAKKYANGNVRTADGTLYTQKEVSAINKDIIKNDNYKAILTSQDLNDKLAQFETEFKKYGTEVGLDKLKFNRTGKTALQNTYTSLLLTAKEFFNLGVLNGPDLAILTAGMPSPVDFELPSEGGRVTEVKGTFLNSKVEEGITRMREMVNQKLQRDYDSVSTSFGEFGDTLPALKNARNVYSQVSGNPLMSELDEVYN